MKTMTKSNSTSNQTQPIIIKSDYDFSYQPDLTKKLDSNVADFDQQLINEIVLWKVNRFAQLTDHLLAKINSINPSETTIDIEITRDILRGLMKTKGVRMAMASTILRFRNPNIYQIIDQRVYRVLYGKAYKPSQSMSDKKIDEQINNYITYLQDLRKFCDDREIPFNQADRILYTADKRINKGKNILY